MNYKLLKDLPLAKAGTIVTNKPVPWTDILAIYNGDDIVSYIKPDQFNQWFEMIPESIFNIKEWQTYYYFTENGIIEEKDWKSDTDDFLRRNFLNVYLNREDVHSEQMKRASLNRILKYCEDNNIQLYTNKEVIEIIEHNTKHEVEKSYWFISFDLSEYYTDYYETWFIDTPLKFKSRDDAISVIENCTNDLNFIYNNFK